jgi:hypothetical protein
MPHPFQQPPRRYFPSLRRAAQSGATTVTTQARAGSQIRRVSQRRHSGFPTHMAARQSPPIITDTRSTGMGNPLWRAPWELTSQSGGTAHCPSGGDSKGVEQCSPARPIRGRELLSWRGPASAGPSLRLRRTGRRLSPPLRAHPEGCVGKGGTSSQESGTSRASSAQGVRGPQIGLPPSSRRSERSSAQGPGNGQAQSLPDV